MPDEQNHKHEKVFGKPERYCMKLEYLNGKKQFVSVALLGLSALFAVLILREVRGFFTAVAKAENAVKTAMTQSKPDPNELKKHLAKSKVVADGLKKKSIFVPAVQKQHPVKQVQGIWGDAMLIGDKWYKVGDKIGDANVVAIEPTKVRIVWQGQEKVFLPINAAMPSRPSGPKRGKPGAEPPKPGEKESATKVQVQLQATPGMGRFEGMSREDMMSGMRGMRERFENMSPEERERLRAEMRERFGGRGGPGGGRPGGGRRGGRGR